MKAKIPIAEGKRLSEKYEAPIVIVFTLLNRGETFNVMTYGATKALCRHAASLGEQIAAKVFNGEISPAAAEPVDLPNVPTIWNSRLPCPVPAEPSPAGTTAPAGAGPTG